MFRLLTRRAASRPAPSLVSMPSKKPLSVDDLRALAVTALRNMGNNRLVTLPAIEYMSLDDLRALPTTGTVLGPVVNALNTAGVPVGATVGEVMDTLNLTQEQLHHGLCHCIHGETITGEHAAENFARFA